MTACDFLQAQTILSEWSSGCRQALQAFCGKVHVGGGLGASMAIGPVGRQAEAALRLGVQGGAMCYSYSMSSGIFAGKLLTSPLQIRRMLFHSL
jgi:lipid-binding SYLF domain-containing protein